MHTPYIPRLLFILLFGLYLTTETKKRGALLLKIKTINISSLARACISYDLSKEESSNYCSISFLINSNSSCICLSFRRLLFSRSPDGGVLRFALTVWTYRKLVSIPQNLLCHIKMQFSNTLAVQRLLLIPSGGAESFISLLIQSSPSLSVVWTFMILIIERFLCSRVNPHV